MMEEDFLVFSPNDDHQHSETEAVQDSSRDLNLDRELQGHLGLEGLNQKQGQLSFSFSPDQAHVQDKDCTLEEVKQKFSPEAYLDPLEGKRLEQTLSDEGSDVSEVWPQHQDQTGHHRHPGLDLDQDQDQDQKLFCIVPDEVVESAGRVPALLITQAEEFPEPVEPQKPAVLGIPLSPTDPSLSSISDGGGDATCSDLLSLRSDSLSISSDPTTYRMSEDDDRTSVTASSVMSLFHRVQLDPLEKDWWRSSALGNVGAQRQLLSQESSLVVKKDFITVSLT
ncbi:uncharacterized protein [Antennarius striatus]|uniref:uncharacterized protein n=1 Tax=Antennarius striatus TaxID=241820 RepID=UPI0035B18225